MGEIRRKSRRRVVEGRPWKQALVCALNPEAPYSPWHGSEHVAGGDIAVVVLDTEPRVVLCAFVVPSTADLRWDIAQQVFTGVGSLPPVSEVDGDGVPTVALSDTARYDDGTPADRAGHSSAAISRILLNAKGRCTVCYSDVLIDTEEDVDRLVHTASAAEVRARTDWPALLCDECATAMAEGGITSVVEFVYSRRPACPQCSAHRARGISFGMMSSAGAMNMTPWQTSGGCCVGPESWSCGECGHEWGDDA